MITVDGEYIPGFGSSYHIIDTNKKKRPKKVKHTPIPKFKNALTEYFGYLESPTDKSILIRFQSIYPNDPYLNLYKK